ncbi:MAG: 2-succinyl-5-enolpyruvyl-6-hydroxy-3-cyclohexene-1-carboxylic-acid synthase [Phormidesmis sp.]
MAIDFRNVNSLWASIAAETLARLGLQTAIVCPGSRSTPLTLAFAQHSTIEALPILDERSAAFFALGCAKRQHQPVALVCTSGTAGANFYPAVIEAYESNVPLLIFTADRPPELRDCAAGQTIDQHKLYGSFTKQYSELSLPVAKVELLAYLRQTLISAWRRASAPLPGPVHFNCPFRDPLSPIADLETEESTRTLATTFNEEQFFKTVVPPPPVVEQTLPPLDRWQACDRGLIVAGPATPKNPEAYCIAVSQIANALGWPVLAEGLSPLRNYCSLNNCLISTYDITLRNPAQAEALIAQNVIQLGPLPISKALRQWLQTTQPQRWVIGSQRNLDPLHGSTHFLSTDVETLSKQIESAKDKDCPSGQLRYRQQWLNREAAVRQSLNQQLTNETALVESKIAWLLSKHLPNSVPLFIANSMPVRDVESFWQPNNRRIQPVFSRGANGIDGTLSTAMGLAHRNHPTVLLTGDLALLHDTNGLLNVSQIEGHLTIILINNNGGGIFEMLPIAQFEPEFEKYFATPQQVKFSALCDAYGVAYHRVEAAADLVNYIERLPEQGVRVLEVVCDRKQSAHQRKMLLNTL